LVLVVLGFWLSYFTVLQSIRLTVHIHGCRYGLVADTGPVDWRIAPDVIPIAFSTPRA